MLIPIFGKRNSLLEYQQQNTNKDQVLNKKGRWLVNFQQLRIVRETVRQNFNLTDVANVLHTSQSGVSKHIKDLEDELGVELYVRKGKRLLGLTEPGREMLKLVERMLLDAGNIKNLADQYSQQDAGQLTVAATHTPRRATFCRG
ncbi:MAG: LysR family transcriptional regulator [Cellvibrionaceae bacterium]|nr:LysR family transcriptional regulator [Cellvibrionaceae bacterium]